MRKRKVLATCLVLATGCTISSLLAEQPRALSLQWRGKPSTRDLLHRLDPSLAFHDDHVDTLHILAIRVEFVPDTVAETTGDGRFLLEPPDEPTIDPPPHDRTYFEAQLQALASYYRTVSNGKLELTWQVYPQELTGAYQLDRAMMYYAPGKDHPESDARLAELFRDAWLAADRAGGIDFSRFDVFVVFHAGVGSDFNFDFDPTPNDVPSAFLNLQDLREALDPDNAEYRGIAVQGGQVHIADGIILPEMESQEGFEIGLLGTAAIMMGFQIGLPALFDTESGASGIGRWGLMDQGSGNFQGMLPAEPSAWEKVFMGWEKPIVVTSGEDFTVAAAREPLSPNHIYKIPINDHEYFLVENRQRDTNGDGIAIGRDVYGNRVEFKDPGQILADSTIGVIVAVDEYDFGLPGSGILIWHVDEAVIGARLDENRINADRDRRGVDLEEADGAQDIGRFYGFLHPGSGAENGVPEDAWHRDNPINKLVNGSDRVEFGPNTMPSSRSNDGADSHITITNFSASGPLMQFSVRHAWLLPGFPVFVGPGSLAPVPAEVLPAVPGKEIIILRRDGALVLITAEGARLGPLQEVHDLTAPGREERVAVVEKLLQLDEGVAMDPVVADIDGNGAVELVAVSDRQTLCWYEIVANDQGGAVADLLRRIPGQGEGPGALAFDVATKRLLWGTGDRLAVLDPAGELISQVALPGAVTGIAVAPELTAVSTAAGVAGIDAALGSLLWTADLPQTQTLALADLDADSRLEVIALTTAGEVAIYTNQGELSRRFAADVSGPAGLSIGDVDGDGNVDLVIAQSGSVHAFNWAGARVEGFPAGRRVDGVFSATEALLLEINTEAGFEVLWPLPDGPIQAAAGGGRHVPDFPVAFSSAVHSGLSVADIDNDGRLELLAVSQGGFLSVLQLPMVPAEASVPWATVGADVVRSRYSRAIGKPVVQNGELLPARLAYNYPNPTEGNVTTIRYRLNGQAEVRIKILDLAGELVDEFPGPAIPNMDNEVQWSLQGVESGVYLARIEARGAAGTGVAVVKIAVVK